MGRAPSTRLHDFEWVTDALKELIDDHGRFPEETAMTEARFAEIKGVVFGDESLLPSPPPPQAKGVMSVGDIIRHCNEAASKMGVENPHRHLILTCATALNQLVARLDRFEGGQVN